MRGLLRLAKNGFLGALCCTSLPTSVLAVGWVQRWMQRRVLRSWHAAAQCEGGFTSFVGADERTREHETTPRWLLGAPPREHLLDRVRSFGVNVRLGFAATFNTWLLTLPAGALWLFAWYDGWNNSFHKGYEQAAVGPLVGLLGVALFVAAMLYVPLAQARQAATGEWRSFWQMRLVWRLARLRWAACVRLAAFYALLSVPVMALKTAPLFFDRLPAYSGWSDAEVLAVLNQYFFWAGALVFGVYLWLRGQAAGIYAGAVVAGVRSGVLPIEQLGALERRALGRLDLLRVEERTPHHPLVRAVGGVTSLTARSAAVALAAFLWLAFVAQIFVSEFLHYHPLVGWLNQPLVLLPWFHYVPPGLG